MRLSGSSRSGPRGSENPPVLSTIVRQRRSTTLSPWSSRASLPSLRIAPELGFTLNQVDSSVLCFGCAASPKPSAEYRERRIAYSWSSRSDIPSISDRRSNRGTAQGQNRDNTLFVPFRKLRKPLHPSYLQRDKIVLSRKVASPCRATTYRGTKPLYIKSKWACPVLTDTLG